MEENSTSRAARHAAVMKIYRRPRAGFWRSLWELSIRTLANVIRNPYLLTLNYVSTIGVAILTGYVFADLPFVRCATPSQCCACLVFVVVGVGVVAFGGEVAMLSHISLPLVTCVAWCGCCVTFSRSMACKIAWACSSLPFCSSEPLH